MVPLMTEREKQFVTSRRLKPAHSSLRTRSEMIQVVRDYFKKGGYLEVETPCRIPTPAPESHIDAFSSADWFLQTSPELFMKRLLAAGFERIFQICKCFRTGERGKKHLPEFTMLEWYTTGDDYLGMMRQCEELITEIAGRLHMADTLAYQGREIHLSVPWDRLTVSEAFARWAPVTMEEALDTNRFDEQMVTHVEPKLGTQKPVFLYDYPASVASLAKLKPEDPSVSERFELYVSGLEICNGFSELNDPEEQRKRFLAEQAQRRWAGKPVYPMPEKFLESLRFTPNAAGNALGIDRLAMLFTDTDTIDDVVGFAPEDL